MSTFVVRFLEIAAGAFRGKARHVRTGEEMIFASPSELIDFFERMHASHRIETANTSIDCDACEPNSDQQLTPPQRKSDPVQDG